MVVPLHELGAQRDPQNEFGHFLYLPYIFAEVWPRERTLLQNFPKFSSFDTVNIRKHCRFGGGIADN